VGKGISEPPVEDLQLRTNILTSENLTDTGLAFYPHIHLSTFIDILILQVICDFNI